MGTDDKYCRREFLKKGLSYGFAVGCCTLIGIKNPTKVLTSNNVTKFHFDKNHPNEEDGQKMKCEITVIKKMFNKDLAEKYCQNDEFSV